MNLYQFASTLAKASRKPDMTDLSVKSVWAVKTDDTKTHKAKKKAAFLRAFPKNLSITLSARLAGIDRSTHYEWLAKDAQYKAAFERKALMAADAMCAELVGPGLRGVFKPAIYKGQFCYVPRKRIICQLADGTSAFQDELPKGAKVIASREVKVKAYDGEMVGRHKHDVPALLKLAALTMPEKYGHALRRVRKPRPS
jgi:hypothetical protein